MTSLRKLTVFNNAIEMVERINLNTVCASDSRRNAGRVQRLPFIGCSFHRIKVIKVGTS